MAENVARNYLANQLGLSSNFKAIVRLPSTPGMRIF